MVTTKENMATNQEPEVLNNRGRIARAIALEIIDGESWKPTRDENFARKMDYLFNLEEKERIKTLGGQSATNPDETLISPKKWADNEVCRELADQMTGLLTPYQIASYIEKKSSEDQKKQGQQILNPYLKITSKLNLNLEEEDKTKILEFERWLKLSSTTDVANPNLLKRFVLLAIKGKEEITPFFIKCLRFSFPAGALQIIPDQVDLVYIDKKGQTQIRSGQRDQEWFEKTAKTVDKLATFFGDKSRPIIAIADTDLDEVRAIAFSSQNYQNAQKYINEVKSRYPNLKIKTFSELARENGQQQEYQTTFLSVAANLLTAGTNDPEYARDWLYEGTTQYGLSPEFIDSLRQAAEKNQEVGFNLAIADKTFSMAVTEEETSQVKYLKLMGGNNSQFVVYTALRIARDIAQIAIEIPSSGKNVFYISDRSLKAVDFGFLGCRVLKKPTLPTIFQKYDQD